MVPTVYSLAVINRQNFKQTDIGDEPSDFVGGLRQSLPKVVVGERLRNQPAVQVFGDRGKPIVGVVVTAFAWPTPQFDYSAQPDGKLGYSRRANVPFPMDSAVTLSGARSLPTNENGIAFFTDLTVTGTTHKIMYLHFYCQGTIVSWSTPQKYVDDNFNPVFNLPLEIDVSANNTRRPTSVVVSAATAAAAVEVTEGKSFPTPPTVAVLPARAGRKVFAVVTRRGTGGTDFSQINGGRQDPNNYKRPSGLPEIATKRLMHAVAETGADGRATFTRLAFQVSGAHGQYEINFVCDGVWAEQSTAVRVRSSIVQAAVLSRAVTVPGAGVHILSRSGSGVTEQEAVTFILRATDALGNGLPGKAPFVRLYRNVTAGLEEIDPADGVAAVALMSPPRPEQPALIGAYTGEDGLVGARVYFTLVNRSVSANATAADRSGGNYFLRFGFDNNETLLSPLVRVSRAKPQPTSVLASQPASARVVNASAVTAMVDVGARVSVEIELRLENGEPAAESDFVAVLCQDDYRPLPNPFRVVKWDYDSNAPSRQDDPLFDKLAPCEWVNAFGHGPTDRNFGCVDANGRITLDFSVIAAPAANADYMPSNPSAAGTSALGWRILLIGSNSTSNPFCINYNGDSTTDPWGRAWDPFCSMTSQGGLDSADPERYIDNICRLAGSAPHLSPVGVISGSDNGGLAVITAATNYHITPMRQPIASLDLVGNMRWANPYNAQIGDSFNSATTSSVYHAFSQRNDNSNFFGQFSATHPFFRAMGHAVGANAPQQLAGKGSSGTAEIRLLNVPEFLPAVVVFGTESSQTQLSTLPEGGINGIQGMLWPENGQKVIGKDYLSRQMVS